MKKIGIRRDLNENAIVNIIAASRSRISINPYNGDFSPKNKNDQKTFSIS